MRLEMVENGFTTTISTGGKVQRKISKNSKKRQVELGSRLASHGIADYL